MAGSRMLRAHNRGDGSGVAGRRRGAARRRGTRRAGQARGQGEERPDREWHRRVEASTAGDAHTARPGRALPAVGAHEHRGFHTAAATAHERVSTGAGDPGDLADGCGDLPADRGIRCTAAVPHRRGRCADSRHQEQRHRRRPRGRVELAIRERVLPRARHLRRSRAARGHHLRLPGRRDERLQLRHRRLRPARRAGQPEQPQGGDLRPHRRRRAGDPRRDQQRLRGRRRLRPLHQHRPDLLRGLLLGQRQRDREPERGRNDQQGRRHLPHRPPARRPTPATSSTRSSSRTT